MVNFDVVQTLFHFRFLLCAAPTFGIVVIAFTTSGHSLQLLFASLKVVTDVCVRVPVSASDAIVGIEFCFSNFSHLHGS